MRTGVGYELGPIDDNVRNYRIPTATASTFQEA